MAPRSATALAGIALAALSAAAALTLGRVFGSAAFIGPVLGAVVLAHLLGAFGRWRGWSLTATLAFLVDGLAAYVVWGLTRGTLWYGIPTGTTLDTVAERLRGGFHELRTAMAPAPARPGAVLLAVVLVWTMAGLADVLAWRRHATIGAVAPSLAVFVWASSLGTGQHRAVATAGYATAALLFLLFQHRSLVEWGRTRFTGRRLGTGNRLLVTGVVTGAVALLCGIVVGPALPGADAGPLLDVRGLGQNGSGGSLSYRTDPPLARIGDTFTRRPGTEVFRVRSPRRSYWRTVALDRYRDDNGGEWTLSATGSQQVRRGLDGPSRHGTFRQEYEITGLEGRWMPAAYRPVTVTGGNPLVVRASNTLVSDRTALAGISYTVSSQVPAGASGPVTARQDGATDTPLPRRLVSSTDLPRDFPADVRDLARAVVAGASTPYEKARALEHFFTDPAQGFRYSLDVDLGPSAQTKSAIAEFLRNRVGFCVQFAGSYAAMARAVGLPARVAVGFTPGTFDAATGTYRVTTDDAHAWPEVWLAGLGWTSFEPTPSSPLPGATPLPGDGSRTGAGTNAPATTATPPAASAPSSTPARPAGANGRTRIEIDAPSGGSDAGSWALLLALPIAAVVGALGAGAGVVALKSSRRRRRRGRRDAAALVGGAWEEILDRLDEVGMERRATRTPLELADDAPGLLPAAALEPLRELAGAYGAMRYGPIVPTSDVAGRAWEQVAAITIALDEDAHLRERWRRRLDPTPLRR